MELSPWPLAVDAARYPARAGLFDIMDAHHPFLFPKWRNIRPPRFTGNL